MFQWIVLCSVVLKAVIIKKISNNFDIIDSIPIIGSNWNLRNKKRTIFFIIIQYYILCIPSNDFK